MIVPYVSLHPKVHAENLFLKRAEALDPLINPGINARPVCGQVQETVSSDNTLFPRGHDVDAKGVGDLSGKDRRRGGDQSKKGGGRESHCMIFGCFRKRVGDWKIRFYDSVGERQ